MGSTFTVALTGSIEQKGIDASADLGAYSGSGMEDTLRDQFYGLSSDVSFEDVEVVEAEVTLSATIRIDGVEVELTDFADFDAESGIDEALGYSGTIIRNAEFEVEDGPTGWDTLEPILGQEQAIEVLVALKRDGLDII